MNLSGMGIVAITFDLDDTLWPCDPVIHRAEQVYFEWLRTHCPPATEHYSSQDLRDKRRTLLDTQPQLINDVSEWRRLATRQLLREFDADESLAEAGFQAFLKARQEVTFYDEVHSALQQLSFHYRLGTITNGNADLQMIGVDHLFDSTQYASLAAPAKPAPDLFLKACEELGTTPDRVLHVGDNAMTDVEGARRVGCRTAWIDRYQRGYPDDIAPADISITSLTELLAMAPALPRR